MPPKTEAKKTYIAVVGGAYTKDGKPMAGRSTEECLVEYEAGDEVPEWLFKGWQGTEGLVIEAPPHFSKAKAQFIEQNGHSVLVV